MRFLIDESTDARLGPFLSRLNHDATLVAHSYRAGLSDKEVLAIAHREGRILVTDDTDFGELIFRHSLPHSGVILLRLQTTRLATKQQRLSYVLSHHGSRLADNFTVVTDRRVRVRRTAQPQ